MARWLSAALLLAAAHALHPPPRPALALSPHTHHLQLFGWRLELQENDAIRSPYYNECKFYKGRVQDEEGSVATVTECAGQLYGLLQVGQEEFVLQPTEAAAHVLRRRDVVLADQPAAYNLTGDTVADLELDLEDEPLQPVIRTRHHHAPTEQFRDATPIITRPVSGVQGLWLELAIVADHTMVKFHGRERVKHYILALMNIVSAIFNDPSLGSNMTLVINKLYLFEEKDPVMRYGNVRKSLEAVNKWNYRHLTKLPAETTGWDAAVWLTRAPLGGPSGFAPVGGVCSRTRSAAIDRDEGLTSAFVIAHELAHLLGLTHDDADQCPSEAHRGSVMAPTVVATLHNFAWSKCSKQQFHEKSRKWWCLHERSGEKGVELGGASELSSYVFSMDEQCRNEFGEGFSVCRSVKVKSACSRLWCAHRASPQVCRSKRAPPMEGTPCGHQRWCVDGVCEPMPGQNSVEEDSRSKELPEEDAAPEWTAWSAWSDCSAPCGYGVRTRRRECRHRGTVSETACEGGAWQAAPCWAGVCAAPRDPRADSCAHKDTRLLPYVHPDESQQCESWCVNYKGGNPSYLGTLPDGAPCSYEKQYDVCYQGACVRGQCNSSDTNCNWCPDGYCNNNTLFYTRYVGKAWAHLVVIPHDAHQLSVHITTPIPLKIAFRERKKERQIIELSNHNTMQFDDQNTYLRYDPNVPQNLQIVEVDSNVIDVREGMKGWRGAVAAAGTLLRWEHTDSDVRIHADSKLTMDMMIMAVPKYPDSIEERMPVEVTVNYSTPAPRTRPQEYRWSTERGPCSASCGGGVRAVRPPCLRGQSCAPTRYERCNMHSCEFSWAAGEWEECSVTCGSAGVQERQLFCVPSYVTVSSRRELVRHSVSPALCPEQKPARQQTCNHLPCPVYWKEMAWTPCSTTCGRGVSYRPLFCPADNELLCGPKPRERRRRCRQRRCPSQPRHHPPCPATDASQHCELFTRDQLRRKCVIPPFRKHCCHACQRVDDYYRGAG